MPQRLRIALAALALAGSGCSWFWPTVVRTDPRDPEVFRSGFPLVGGLSPDGALCSLATIGPEATTLVRPPGPVEGAVALDAWCGGGDPVLPGQSGRAGRLAVVDGRFGRARGYLFPVPAARGLLVTFTGLGMDAGGWVNARFAALAAQRGLATFAPVRSEDARPMVFDPLLEARRALGAALEIVERCGVRQPRLLFVGVSMGGMEALLASREAAAERRAARAAVLDPLLDPPAVADHLDGFWHSMATDAMQAYFTRILRGRYGEPRSTSFHDLLNRSAPDTVTVIARDAPRAWLCRADPVANAVFLSDGDPVLGSTQADFARACRFPLRSARAKGHVGLACRLELFQELLDAVDVEGAGTPAKPPLKAPRAWRRSPGAARAPPA